MHQSIRLAQRFRNDICSWYTYRGALHWNKHRHPQIHTCPQRSTHIKAHIPALPARWLADACEIGVMSRESMPERGSRDLILLKPVSTTYTIPGMVTDVSATFVATTTCVRLCECIVRMCVCMCRDMCACVHKCGSGRICHVMSCHVMLCHVM